MNIDKAIQYYELGFRNGCRNQIAILSNNKKFKTMSSHQYAWRLHGLIKRLVMAELGNPEILIELEAVVNHPYWEAYFIGWGVGVNTADERHMKAQCLSLLGSLNDELRTDAVRHA